MGTINYHRTGDVVEIIIRDYSGAKIETLRCAVKQKAQYKKILDYLKEKYGFSPEVDVPDAPKATAEPTN